MKRTLIAAALSASFFAPAFAANTIRQVGTPDNGLTSHALVNQTPPVPLSYRATDAAAQQWLQTGVANDIIGHERASDVRLRPEPPDDHLRTAPCLRHQPSGSHVLRSATEKSPARWPGKLML